MANKKTDKKRQLTTFISPNAYQVIKKQAADNDRSVSDMARIIIENALKKDIKKL